MLLTAGLMFAPQLGVGVFVLLLSLGHIGTAVPLLLTWLVIDRLRPLWAVPVIVGVLLTWVLVADPLVLLVGIIPLVAVCALRIARELSLAQRRGGPGWARGALRARWYELSLAVAAIIAVGLASAVSRLLRPGGGFFLHPVPYQLAPVHTWPKHAWVTGEGLLALFGARPQGPAAALAFALLHLAGVALVAWAMARVARHFISWPDMISQILLVAMVINVVAYVPSTLADATDLNAREFAIVLPFGAVLAGRALAPSLPAGLRRAGLRWADPGSGRPAAAPPGRGPAGRRTARRVCGQPGLRGGSALCPARQRAAGGLPGRAPPDQRHRRVLGVERGHRRQRRRRHDTRRAARHAAAGPVGSQGLLVRLRAEPCDVPGHRQRAWILQPLAAQPRRAGGPRPAATTYHVGPYTIYVWNKNLLAGLGRR